MPKNLSPYYNYYYKRFKKHKKYLYKPVYLILIVVLTLLFNNLGLLDSVINTPYLLFNKTEYYLLVLTNKNNINNSDLQVLGCATSSLNSYTVLNVYINKTTCESVANKISENNFNCETLPLTLNSIYLSTKFKSNYTTLKNVIKQYKSTINSLINICEKYDKSLVSKNDIFFNCSTIKQGFTNSLNKLNNSKEGFSNKITILIRDAVLVLDNLIKFNGENFSSYLKTCTVNLVLNFKTLLY